MLMLEERSVPPKARDTVDTGNASLYWNVACLEEEVLPPSCYFLYASCPRGKPVRAAVAFCAVPPLLRTAAREAQPSGPLVQPL